MADNGWLGIIVAAIGTGASLVWFAQLCVCFRELGSANKSEFLPLRCSESKRGYHPRSLAQALRFVHSPLVLEWFALRALATGPAHWCSPEDSSKVLVVPSPPR